MVIVNRHVLNKSQIFHFVVSIYRTFANHNIIVINVHIKSIIDAFKIHFHKYNVLFVKI